MRGAPARYLMDRAISSRVATDLPVGTFVVNLSGSLLLGFLTGLSLKGHLSTDIRDALDTGFCGAYTTFSTFTFETLRLVEEGDLLEAAGNVVVSALLGLAAAAAGLAIGMAV